VEQVVDGGKAFGGKHLGEARSDAFYILHWSGGFQHLKEC
jgi:hypothetical protein